LPHGPQSYQANNMQDFENRFHEIISKQAIVDPAHDINHIHRVVRSAGDLQ
jgi:HD superfamily phosphodiesterase